MSPNAHGKSLRDICTFLKGRLTYYGCSTQWKMFTGNMYQECIVDIAHGHFGEIRELMDTSGLYAFSYVQQKLSCEWALLFHLLCPALSFCALFYLNLWASWITIRVHVQGDSKKERVGTIMVLALCCCLSHWVCWCLVTYLPFRVWKWMKESKKIHAPSHSVMVDYQWSCVEGPQNFYERYRHILLP